MVRFLNADAYIVEGQGIIGLNLFIYCSNSVTTRIDYEGTRDRKLSFLSFKNDEIGLELLMWYLFGDGKNLPVTDKYGDYLSSNEILQKQIHAYLAPNIQSSTVGTTTIDMSVSAIIENGEDMIGYQYLHGTNADVGGFQIQGTITKFDNGDCFLDMTYTRNDILDPNPMYGLDVINAKLADVLSFGRAQSYEISISWNQKEYIANKFKEIDWLELLRP